MNIPFFFFFVNVHFKFYRDKSSNYQMQVLIYAILTPPIILEWPCDTWVVYRSMPYFGAKHSLCELEKEFQSMGEMKFLILSQIVPPKDTSKVNMNMNRPRTPHPKP